MDDLFRNFGVYLKNAEFESFEFWLIPIGTVLIIWFFTVVGPKIFTSRKKIKTIFVVHNVAIFASILVAAILIGLICYFWSINYFSQNPIQLSLLISLFIALFIPIISFISLRTFFTIDNLNKIAHQAKTKNQFDKTITETRKVFGKNKLSYLILIPGFLFLLFAFLL